MQPFCRHSVNLRKNDLRICSSCSIPIIRVCGRVNGEGETREPAIHIQRHCRRQRCPSSYPIPAIAAIFGIAGAQCHLVAARHRLSTGGRHHARSVRAVLVADQPRAVRGILPMQPAAAAYRGEPVPAHVPVASGLHHAVHSRMAEIRPSPERGVHERHRTARRARHTRRARHRVRGQTHSLAHAVAHPHRILLVLVQCGRRSMVVGASAYHPADQLFRTSHVSAVCQ